MPSPVGHALGGLLVALVLAPHHEDHEDREAHEVFGSKNPKTKPRVLRDLRDLRGYAWLGVVVACIPDVDFAWGRHNMETHSVGFALASGLVVYAWRRSARLAMACGLAIVTHVLFDWLGSDDAPPLGVMAFWPFTSAFYFADAYVFEAISRQYWLPGFVRHNVLAVLREMAILLPLTAAAYFLRCSRARSNQSSGGAGAE